MPDDFRSDEELPLDELRAAWTSLRPREPAEEADQADARTGEVVDWLRAAWGTVEAPVLQRPGPRVPAGRLLFLRGSRLAKGVAAAAVVLVAFGSWALFQRPAPDVRSPDEDMQVHVPPAPADGPRVASLGPDYIELRSGPVRLILFDGRNQGD